MLVINLIFTTGAWRRALTSIAVLLLVWVSLPGAPAQATSSFPVTSATLKNKAGINVEPGMRPWHYNGPAPDSWWCQQGVDCAVDPNNPYQVQGPLQVIDHEMQEASSLGVATIRIEFDWPLLEPSRGTFTWSRADYIVNEANKYGIQLQPVLVYTPQWASSAPNSSNWYEMAPANVSDWTTFVTQVVDRYQNCIHYWEIWNEPDGGGYWYGGQGAGLQDWVSHILNPGYQAVKAVDPSARVIVGSYYADTTWYDGVVADGGGNSFDILSFHNYTNTALSDVQTMQSWLNAHGMGSKPIWIGEYGYAEATNTTDDTNHQALLTTVLRGDGYQQAQWYTLRDEWPRSCCPVSGTEAKYFGLIEHDDVTLKAGFSTMQQLDGASTTPLPRTTDTPTPNPTSTPPIVPTAAASPSGKPSVSITITGVAIVRSQRGRLMHLRVLHVGEKARFLVMYRTRNAEGHSTRGRLRITRNGRSIAVYSLIGGRIDGHLALFRVISLSRRDTGTTLYAQFSVVVGPVSAQKSQKFSLRH